MPPVVGRERELAALRGVVDEARSGSASALLVTGEAGIGKTALLGSLRHIADDAAVLACHGVPGEAALAHAGLLELLAPVGHLLGEVPETQAAALGAALGWRSARDGVDRFLVGAGVLSLLSAAASERPLVVVVDDLHWLDRESADAVLFAARRSSGERVAFVMAARDGTLAPEWRTGIRVLRVGGLGEGAAAALLSDDVSPVVAERLRALTGGNPLGLLEVAGRLTAAQRTGAASLPDPLPAGDLLHTVYDPVVTGLAPEVDDALLLVALDPVVGVRIAPRAGLDEAAARRLLVSGEQGDRFRHPLVRSAVLRRAPASRVRAAHQRLADQLPADSVARVLHLAAAATGPDDDLAEALVAAAEGARTRAGYAAASAHLRRAALLTTDDDLGAERLAEAAGDSFVAGDLDGTRDLVEEVVRRPCPPAVRGRALLVLGLLEQYAGSVVRAADVLAEACALLEGSALTDALTERAVVAFRLGDVATIAECALRLEGDLDADDPGSRLRARAVTGLVRFLAGDYDAAGVVLDDVTALALDEVLRDDPRALLLMAIAAALSGSVEEALRRGASRIDDLRRRGAIGVLVPLLALSAGARSMVGDHERAFADAGEAVELADCLGFVADTAIALEQLAWQHAARGSHDEATAALLRAREMLERAGTVDQAAHHALNSAYCALCRDDLPEVAALLEDRLEVDGGLGMMGEPLGVAPLLVEAWVGLGRRQEAVSLTQRFAAAYETGAPAEVAALLMRCRGLVADDVDEAAACLRTVVEGEHRHADPFERARARLLLGSRLRREGRRRAARDQLEPARAAFERMGLLRWRDVAAAELRATGASARARTAGTGEALTSQETRVALLVAEGRTNKDVAAVLFLSPKTVERHLGNIFRKRGFRSRVELARAYAVSGQ
ncbi:AAA family ATPase [Nocardioides aestuarii]|uniref:AAA family ATPase n=1 Tax=Nocardioides aestuarii TaxID=252231 RepID=A0ABW4TTL5_9ACTN